MPFLGCVERGREGRCVVVYPAIHQHAPHPPTPRRKIINPPRLHIDTSYFSIEMRGEDAELDGAAPCGGCEDGGGVGGGGQAEYGFGVGCGVGEDGVCYDWSGGKRC